MRGGYTPYFATAVRTMRGCARRGTERGSASRNTAKLQSAPVGFARPPAGGLVRGELWFGIQTRVPYKPDKTFDCPLFMVE